MDCLTGAVASQLAGLFCVFVAITCSCRRLERFFRRLLYMDRGFWFRHLSRQPFSLSSRICLGSGKPYGRVFGGFLCLGFDLSGEDNITKPPNTITTAHQIMSHARLQAVKRSLFAKFLRSTCK